MTISGGDRGLGGGPADVAHRAGTGRLERRALGGASWGLLPSPADGMVVHRSWWGSGAGGVWGVTIEGEWSGPLVWVVLGMRMWFQWEQMMPPCPMVGAGGLTRQAPARLPVPLGPVVEGRAFLLAGC